MTEGVDARQKQFIAEMSKIDSVVEVLLKGHLLIEEALDRLIDRHVSDGKSLEDARLTFNQKLCLAKALRPSTSGAWEVIEAINALRNDVSHRLNSPGRQKKLARLKETYLRQDPDPDLAETISKGPDALLVVAACAFAAGCLAVLESRAR